MTVHFNRLFKIIIFVIKNVLKFQEGKSGTIITSNGLGKLLSDLSSFDPDIAVRSFITTRSKVAFKAIYHHLVHFLNYNATKYLHKQRIS